MSPGPRAGPAVELELSEVGRAAAAVAAFDVWICTKKKIREDFKNSGDRHKECDTAEAVADIRGLDVPVPQEWERF